MNKYEFMALLLAAFALVAVGLAFALRDDGRTRRIYVRHERWEAEPPPAYRAELIPRRITPLPPVVDAPAEPRQVAPRRKAIER